jgi:pyroglutamyl-peptidase
LSTKSVVLLTGFEPFSGQPFNVSAEGVREFCESGDQGERAELSWRVLPVVYDEAAALLGEAIDELKPRVIISVGICDEPCYRIERVAHNLDDTEVADNKGEVRRSLRIIQAGPESFAAPYPHAELARGLEEKGLPWRYSDSAGGFLCNHVFYHLCQRAAVSGSGIECATFLHVPPLGEGEETAGLVDAIGCAVAAALDGLS